MNFNHEELTLMMLYNTGTRMGLIHELRLMQCYLMPDETALRELSEGVIEKLKLLTDAEFGEFSSYRSFPLQNHNHCLKQYFNIQAETPVADIFCIQSYNFFEVSDIASSAYLPHTGDSRFNSDSSPVM